MSKIICEVCGTSYPETAAQCPICGCVHKAPARAAAPSRTQKSSSGEYNYVKGGRFSQANVNKRNNTSGSAYSAKPAGKGKRKKKKSSKNENRGLIITIIILLIAIIAVIGYIFVKFFMPSTSNGKVNNPSADVPAIQAGQCEQIVLDMQVINFSAAGETAYIDVDLIPTGVTQTVEFTSNNAAVATVSNNGEVTAVGSGEAVITVSCGSVKTECSVICAFDGSDLPEPSDAFQLNRDKITFQNAGETWIVYNGEIPVEDISWSIDDENVATVMNGKVTAVANGTTTMYAEYEGTKHSCQVICQLDDSATTQDDGNAVADNGPYKLFNIYGNASDVSIRKGDSFSLQLVDKDGNEVTGVIWSVKEGSSCTVDNGKITAVSGGKSVVAASYNGKEYTCIVRVS